MSHLVLHVGLQEYTFGEVIFIRLPRVVYVCHETLFSLRNVSETFVNHVRAVEVGANKTVVFMLAACELLSVKHVAVA